MLGGRGAIRAAPELYVSARTLATGAATDKLNAGHVAHGQPCEPRS